MAGAMTGFLTGFLTETAASIGKRKDEAHEYFESQMKIARTRGLENRKRIDAVKTQGLTVAKQLKQVGVPDDLIIAAAKQNPDDLPTLLAEIQNLQAKGVRTDEAFFRDFLQVSGEARGEGETIDNVFHRIYGGLAQADPEVVNQDPKGSIWASMMGYNAMERADQKLRETQIADGLTAADLLAEPDPDIGNTTVTMNAALAGDAVRDLREDGPEKISTTENARVMQTYEENLQKYRMGWKDEAGNGWRDSDQYSDAIDKQFSDQALQDTVDVFTADPVLRVPVLRDMLTGGGSQEPQAVEETTGEAPVSEAPVAEEPPITQAAPEGAKTFGQWTLVQDKGDGTSIWKNSAGKTKLVDNSEAPGYLGLSRKEEAAAPPSVVQPKGLTTVPTIQGID